MMRIYYPYQKSIRFNPNGFSLLKKEREDSVVRMDYPLAGLTTFKEKCRDFFQKNNHDEINILINTHVPVLIPSVLYEEEAEAKYLGMQFVIDDLDRICRDNIGEYKAVYFIHSNMSDSISTLDEPYSIHHYQTYIYEHILLHHSFQNHATLLYLNIEKETLRFFLTREEKPFLLNQFRFTSEYDVLYYVLNIFKQCRLSVTESLLIIEGPEEDSYLTLLRQYIPAVKLMKEILS